MAGAQWLGGMDMLMSPSCRALAPHQEWIMFIWEEDGKGAEMEQRTHQASSCHAEEGMQNPSGGHWSEAAW